MWNICCMVGWLDTILSKTICSMVFPKRRVWTLWIYTNCYDGNLVHMMLEDDAPVATGLYFSWNWKTLNIPGDMMLTWCHCIIGVAIVIVHHIQILTSSFLSFVLLLVLSLHAFSYVMTLYVTELYVIDNSCALSIFSFPLDIADKWYLNISGDVIKSVSVISIRKLNARNLYYSVY